jgi:hypothetical protein
MITYQLTQDVNVIWIQPNGKGRGSTEITPSGEQWAAYQAWLARGNTPDPAEPPEPPAPSRTLPTFRGNSVPDLVTELNALRALLVSVGVIDS